MTKQVSKELTKDRQEMLDSMPPALRKKVLLMQELDNKSRQAELLQRYEFCEHVAQIQEDPDKYGNAGIAQLALWFDVSERNMQYFVSIYKAFSREQIAELQHRKDHRGYVLSWTHLRSLTSIEKQGDRNKLLKQWEKESLSSLDFAKRVQEFNDAKAPQNDSGGGPQVSRRANENEVRTLVKQIISVDQRMDRIESADLSAFLVEGKKREMLEKLIEQLGILEVKITEVRKRITEVRAADQQDELIGSSDNDDSEPVEADDLLADLEDDGTAEDAVQSVVQQVMKAPVKNTGSRRKHGLPGSKANQAHAKATAKAKSKAKAKAGPEARRRRGAAAGA